jgi:hypothetical protein
MINEKASKVIYFQPEGINPEFCEIGMLVESDPDHVWYLDEPCKSPLSDVKIVPKEKVSFDKKLELYRYLA